MKYLLIAWKIITELLNKQLLIILIKCVIIYYPMILTDMGQERICQ
jgi:hypothetical protein